MSTINRNHSSDPRQRKGVGSQFGNARAFHPNSHYRADGQTGVRMGATLPILTTDVAIEY